MEITGLIKSALKAREFAYVPISGFRVGAALLSKSGGIFNGCNIENASFSPTNCAERTAFFKAVSEGEREFDAIAIVGGYKGEPEDYCPPCGVCRQVMLEFCAPDFMVILAKNEHDYQTYTLDELIPHSFGPSALKK
jgi:cytidine deaminase